MKPESAFAVALLESSLAAQSAGVALGLRDELGAEACARLGRFEELGADARMRLRHLIEAVALECAPLYTEFLAWQRATHAARGIEARFLAAALRGQRRVLTEGLPRPALATLEPFLAAGEQALGAPLEREPEPPGGAYAAWVQRGLELGLTGKRDPFLEFARQAHAELGLAAFLDGVLAGLLTELGRLWQRGEIHVGEEHLVARLVEDALARLPTFGAAAATNVGRALVATPAGDLHELGARLVAAGLERRGWEVALLGANVPCTDLVRSALELEAEVVLLSVSQGLFVRAAAEVVAELRAARPELVVLVGGAPFRAAPELAARIGADAWAPSASRAEELARMLVPTRRAASGAQRP